MSGVVIFTRDAAPYRVGEYVEMYSFDYPPTAPDTTYILHDNKFSEKDAEGWVDLIPYRLIVVTDKQSINTNDERVFGDKTVGGRSVSYRRNIEALFKWADRLRVLRYIATVPLPLVSSFVRVNRADDIETGRRLAASRFHLPDEYTHSILAYSIHAGASKVIWPKKRAKLAGSSIPFTRASDKYAEDLLALAPEIRNELRDKGVEVKGLKKTKESVTEWL
tara:strand:+ start:22529 stop:23191 length:663 start_codon:yes stop_codon:yes gene_type:complete